jgi:U3 small nucleolar ribonucleoprotein protein LCP5
MANPVSFTSLLDSLQQSLSSAQEATPRLVGVEPPKHGNTLLETKNELLLSYIQNLVFLILLKIRGLRSDGHSSSVEQSEIRDQVVKKLVELRLYLEQGVRPLEDKLHYMIGNVVRAADNADQRSQSLQHEDQVNGKRKGRSRGKRDSDAEWSDQSGSDEADMQPSNGTKAADKQFQPMLAALAAAKLSEPGKAKNVDSSKPGLYRPPRVTPVTMPTTERKERTDRRPQKSATLDEFINNELSSAPIAEPSIGTTIVASGRRNRTATERAADAERADYEERNFVRLPKETKKERQRKAKSEGRSGRMEFGGEEWRDLGEGVDRINRLTKGKSSGGGTRALLEKSRKRGIDTADGPRGSGVSEGVQMGERFQKRVRIQEGGRRDRGKKRSIKP